MGHTGPVVRCVEITTMIGIRLIVILGRDSVVCEQRADGRVRIAAQDVWSQRAREDVVGLARAEVGVCQRLGSWEGSTGAAVMSLGALLRHAYVARGDVGGG